MKQALIASFLTALSAVVACKTKQREESLTIVAFGPADSVTMENKGFSARVYSFIDFSNDSVFVRDKYINCDSIATIKTGKFNGVFQNEDFIEIMKILDSHENGEMIGKERMQNDQYPDLYCGWDIFVEYKKDGISKWVYTSRHTIDPFVELINYTLEDPSLIRDDSMHIDDNYLIASIVNREGFALNHPPVVKTIIKFLPPKTDSTGLKKSSP